MNVVVNFLKKLNGFNYAKINADSENKYCSLN